VDRGLAGTRTEAAGLILAGRVRLAGQVADKPGRPVRADAAPQVVGRAPFVSRGGEKLTAALDAFGVSPAGRACLDVGASTGGFTDCLLQRGASRVVAVDVGHGQLDARLRADARVRVLEGVNARGLEPDRLGEPAAGLATVDVAFISLGKVLPAIVRCLRPGGEIVALVKPQFEVGPEAVGRGGVVRDPAVHAAAVRGVAAAARGLGLAVAGVIASPLRGPKGNREFFVWLSTEGPGLAPEVLEARIGAAVAVAP
jgi:23S rRNA (cytidine1920-2'-O)/16S rRNA (cytidine1409-2'-O)-methyltransferase